MKNTLYYGDNLDALRNRVKDESVDLVYIDPPFNSKRNYNQIYNNIGSEDRAQEQAFVDTWTWDDQARQGFEEIIENAKAWFQPQTVELIKGLRNVLKEGSLLAYVVSMTRRIVEIHRVLKPTGTFYLHCDPTSSHYLKLVLDGVFCADGGDFRNELIWSYESGGRSKKDFSSKHDVIFRYTKSGDWTFNAEAVLLEREKTRHNHMKKSTDPDGRVFYSIKSNGKVYKYYADQGVIPSDVWTDFSHLQQKDPERLGYPTQKPEALLERMIRASSNEGDLILDAYCGCGTTVAVAQKLNRQWIGMDITYQSIALILKRLGPEIANTVILDGAPRDMESARQLALRKDDRTRKEFEKWAVLTYTENRGAINGKKGADAGIDGTAYFLTSATESAKMVFQVKSGHVGRGDIAKLKGDMQRENAPLATFITLEEPTAPMRSEAKAAGSYTHELTRRRYDKIQIVTIKQILEQGKRLELPLSLDVLPKSQPVTTDPEQFPLFKKDQASEVRTAPKKGRTA